MEKVNNNYLKLGYQNIETLRRQHSKEGNIIPSFNTIQLLKWVQGHKDVNPSLISQLTKVQVNHLTNSQRCYWLFLMGLCFFRKWEAEQSSALLEEANIYFDELFTTAANRYESVRLSQWYYFYYRARTKLEIAKITDNQEDKDRLVIVAALVTRNGSKENPDFKSLLWIQKQLQNI